MFYKHFSSPYQGLRLQWSKAQSYLFGWDKSCHSNKLSPNFNGLTQPTHLLWYVQCSQWRGFCSSVSPPSWRNTVCSTWPPESQGRGKEDGRATLALFKNYFIEVWLIYNVMLVSGVQHSDLDMYLYIFTHTHIFFFRFFSPIGYYKILSTVPCALQ